MCKVEVYYRKEAIKKFVKEVMVHYVDRKISYLLCNEHKPFVCAVCFREWYFYQGPLKNTQPSKVITKESEPLKEEKRKRFEKYSLVNSEIKERKFMTQTQTLFTGQKIGIGNQLKILLKVLFYQFVILLQDPEFLISMEVVVLKRQRMQFKFSKT